jgi:hypothetical protein
MVPVVYAGLKKNGVRKKTGKCRKWGQRNGVRFIFEMEMGPGLFFIIKRP